MQESQCCHLKVKATEAAPELLAELEETCVLRSTRAALHSQLLSGVCIEVTVHI